ncbi:MAG: acyl-CoA dehydrogenase family protein [Thermoleophilaceae bacterium]
MPVALTEEQRSFLDAVRDFCARECGSRQDDAFNSDAVSHSEEIAARMADLGWLGVSIPEEYGGSGGGLVEACLLIEEIARGRAPMTSFMVTLIIANAYRKFASEPLKHEVLGGIAQGRVESIAMSEPEAGSDVASLTCRAEPVDGGYLVNGQKTWCTNAHIADHILLVCRTSSEGAKHEGLSMLSIPTGVAGLDRRPIPTMGGRDVNDLFFTDCFIGEDRLIGTDGRGWAQLTAGLNIERVLAGGLYIGYARRSFELVLDYVKQRKQFGRPVGSFQALAHRIADLATEIEATRLLVYDVARQVDQNPDKLLPREASMVKLKATELAKRASLEGMQMMGGYGYASEYDMERLVRATLVGTIAGGTSEIQREVIAKTYGL